MKFFVYSVKDEKVSFGYPFYVEADARADMHASEAVKKAYEKGTFGQTAIDCTLYKIATFDNKTGEHENYRFPEVILRVKDLMLNVKDGDDSEVSETV